MFKEAQLLYKLKNNLKNLPGYSAHKLMLPKHREHSYFDEKGKLSSVLILLYPKDDFLNFVLVKRVADNSAHSGQISLPGGQRENDEFIFQTAIRETYEEIGVEVKQSDILGFLSSIYIPVSNFNVFPVLAFLEYSPTFFINLKEIQKIYEVRLSDFINFPKLNKQFISGNQVIEAPCYLLEAKDYIWGATAMILSELTWLIKN